MNKCIKKIIGVAFFIVGLTSCDSDFNWVGNNKTYMYYADYAEYNYFSSDGDLVQTVVMDSEYNGNKIMSSIFTTKDIKSNTTSITNHTYEYDDLICKHLYNIESGDYQFFWEETIEYLDYSYRHIKHRTLKGSVIVDGNTSGTYSVTDNKYNGKCITQSKTQNYTCYNEETTPGGYTITTYSTNGLHQTSTTKSFDADDNLISTSSTEYTYLNDDYCDYTESIVKDSNGLESSRTVNVYNDSNRITEYRLYTNNKLVSQQNYEYDGDSCLVSGFSGDLTMVGTIRYIKIQN